MFAPCLQVRFPQNVLTCICSCHAPILTSYEKIYCVLSTTDHSQSHIYTFDHTTILALWLQDISCGIDNDEYFELMMRNAWHISGGEGAAANTTCMRVLVTHTDGSQTVEEVKNDLGIRFGDVEAVVARLNTQGITDIKEVSF